MADQFYSVVDYLGRPIRKELLTQRLSLPTVTGVRQAVGMSASRGLTPERLARILRAAENDDPEQYLALAEEMEEKDGHYNSVLGTRKRQVAQLQMTVSAATGSTDPKDKLAAELVQTHLVDTGVLDDWLFDALDAVGKGFSLSEIVWNTSASTNLWTIDQIDWVDPRFVRFDRITRRRPMLLGDGGMPEELEPGKFVFLTLKAKSGLPIRAGLARIAAWSFLFKNFALKDWVQFCEVYGLPLRVGTYDSSASEEDKEALLAALRMIAIDAAGIIPKTMEIKFIEAAQKGGAADFYKLLYSTMDDQVSKAVIGQTGTADAVPGQLGGGNEKAAVREDIERADAKKLSSGINKQIVKTFVDFNLGPRPNGYPVVTIGRAETKNAALIIQAAKELVPMGYRIAQTDIDEAIGVSTPGDDEKVLTPPAYIPRPDQATPAGISDATTPPAADIQAAIGAARTRATILAQDMQEGDPIARAAAEQGDATIGKAVAQIMQLAALSATPAEFVRRLHAMRDGLDLTELQQRLALLTFQAVAGGVVGDTLQ